MKVREIYYTGQRNSKGELTYQKFLEDIWCDPEFDTLVDGLE